MEYITSPIINRQFLMRFPSQIGVYQMLNIEILTLIRLRLHNKILLQAKFVFKNIRPVRDVIESELIVLRNSKNLYESRRVKFIIVFNW